MRNVLVVLSASVTAGLAVFFLFDALNAIGTLSDSIMVRMDVFVAFIAALTLAAAALALVFRRASMRAEARDIQDLRERVARLEAGR